MAEPDPEVNVTRPAMRRKKFRLSKRQFPGQALQEIKDRTWRAEKGPALIFKTKLPFIKTRRQPETLTFREQDIQRHQPRLKGRTVLVPEIDLDAYRFHAVIDWVGLRFVLRRDTQFRYLQDSIELLFCRKCHVVPVDAGPGRVSNTFDVKFQEPRSIAALLDICDKLEGTYGLVSRPEVIGIEVSVDAYPRQPSDMARALMLGAIQRTIFTDRDIWTNQNDRPRFVFRSNEHRAAGEETGAKKIYPPTYIAPDPTPGRAAGRSAFNPDHFEIPPVDATMYLGSKNGPVMIRVMDKIIDQQNLQAGTWLDLDDRRKRVRIEVTLMGDELKKHGIGTIDDLASLNIRKLQKRYFQFMRPSFEKNQPGKMSLKGAVLDRRTEWRKKVFVQSGVISVMAMDRERERFRKQNLSDIKKVLRRQGKAFRAKRTGIGTMQQMTAYGELNEKVGVALRKLGEREVRAMKVAKAEIKEEEEKDAGCVEMNMNM